MKYFGLDLTGSARPSGYAVLDGTGALADVGVCVTDDEICALVARHGARTVAIDCPLGLPAGLCCLEASCECAASAPDGVRASERAVRGAGLWPVRHDETHDHPRDGVSRHRAAAPAGGGGRARLEVYPFATKATLFGRLMPKKTTPKGARWLRERLSALVPGLAGVPRALTHDELDAVVAASTALLLDRGEAVALGDDAEGAIVVPSARGAPR